MSGSNSERKRWKKDDDADKHPGARTEDIPDVLRKAREVGILGPSSEGLDPAAMFYDLEAFDGILSALRRAFPSNFRHCVAVKSNPLKKMLQMAVEHGFGLECASISEVEMAVHAGAAPHMVVFDSPCKTIAELTRALELGVHVNCNSVEEVHRIAQLLEKKEGGIAASSSSVIGLRVNPLLGEGQIRALSVSNKKSKFGVPFSAETRESVIGLFTTHKFLTALHVHVGSQGCSLRMLASGAATIYELAEQLGGASRIKVLDIGGGLPTNFSSDQSSPTFAEYAKELEALVPALFREGGGGYTGVTEFGRAIHAKLGWTVSTCEYSQESDGVGIAITHFGSDMFVRTCYCPKDFPMRVQVFSSSSCELKTSSKKAQNVVGPLCFGGDVICEGAELPAIENDDYIVVRDAGANCLSLWSRHCSRPSPAVYGYRRTAEGGIDIVTLRRKESLEHVFSFWE